MARRIVTESDHDPIDGPDGGFSTGSDPRGGVPQGAPKSRVRTVTPRTSVRAARRMRISTPRLVVGVGGGNVLGAGARGARGKWFANARRGRGALGVAARATISSRLRIEAVGAPSGWACGARIALPDATGARDGEDGAGAALRGAGTAPHLRACRRGRPASSCAA